MNYATDISPIVFDLESAPLENARDFIAPPDLTDISAPSNYVKQDAIDSYIEREKAKRLADFETDVTDKAALDWNVGRIVALAYWTAAEGIQVRVCQTEAQEAQALRAFWSLAKHRTIVGFNVKGFDLRYMVQRSRYLGVPYPMLDLGKYGRSGIIDLYLDLTFNDGSYDKGVMRRSLRSFAKRFGIPVNDDVSGADMPALVAAGDWSKVESHVAADIDLTVALAKRLGVIPVSELEAVI